MRALATLTLLPLLAACNPSAPAGVDVHRLDAVIGEAVGDPNTCVLLVEKGTAKVVYRYGTHANCGRPLPSCNTEGSLTADDLAKMAAKGETRTLSCDSGPGGVNRVAWAAGPVEKSPESKAGDLAYAAVMESPSALPGREIAIRLAGAFRRAGL